MRRISSRISLNAKIAKSKILERTLVPVCVFLLPSKCKRSRLSNFLCAFDLVRPMRTYALVLRRVLAFAGAELKCVHANIKPAYEHCFIALLFNVCLAKKVAAALALAGLFRHPPFVDRACDA